MWRYERPALAGCLALLGLCGAAVAALQLSLNGVVAAQGRDSTFARGDVGLLAATFEDPGVDVRFDNFVVREP